MDLEGGCGLDDSLSTRLVVIGSRWLALVAGRTAALDPVGCVPSGGHSMAPAQPGLGQEGSAEDGDQVADKRLLCHALAADEQGLGLDGRAKDPRAIPTDCLRRLFNGLWRQHSRGHGS